MPLALQAHAGSGGGAQSVTRPQQIQHAQLCHCGNANAANGKRGGDAAAAAAAACSGGGGGGDSGLPPRSAAHSPPGDAGGRVLLLTEERAAELRLPLQQQQQQQQSATGDAGPFAFASASASASGPGSAATPASLLVGHGPRCALVLVKTPGLHANYEHTARLKYELAIHSLLQAETDKERDQAEQPQGQTQTQTQTAPLSSPSLVRSRALIGNVGALAQQRCFAQRQANSRRVEAPAPAATPHLLNVVRPHLRSLSDLRLALVLPDHGGTLLETLLRRRAQLHLSHSAHMWSTHGAGGRALPLQQPHPRAIQQTLASVESALQLTLHIALALSRLHSLGLIHKVRAHAAHAHAHRRMHNSLRPRPLARSLAAAGCARAQPSRVVSCVLCHAAAVCIAGAISSLDFVPSVVRSV